MNFRHAEKENYEDLAAGHVLYGHSGHANFPVRLGSEIFNRCVELSVKKTGLRLYDPCCGGGYLLTTVALTNLDRVAEAVGSDADAECLTTAQKNLGLLSEAGLARRKTELEALYSSYQKESHHRALQSLERVSERVRGAPQPVTTQLFQADILDSGALKGLNTVPDIVLVDVPYGGLVSWTAEEGAVSRMLRTLASIETEHLVIAVVSGAPVKENPVFLARREKFKIGKRYVSLYEKGGRSLDS